MSTSPEEPGICTRTGFRQMLYAVIASSVELSIGMSFGLAAVMQPQMAASDMEASLSQAAWFVSIVYLLIPLGNLVNGLIMDRFGRSIAIQLGTLPLLAGWLYTGLSKTLLNVIIGRAITGFGCGMATAPPRVYIAEIALPNMRGVLGSFSPITTSLGITIQSALGSLLQWHITCYLCAAYTAGVFFITFLLPETPYFLMKKQRPREEIGRSLQRFRGDGYNVEAELERMENFKNAHPMERLTVCGSFKQLFTRPVYLPFLIVATYILIAQLSGIAIMVQWTVKILNESKVTVNSNVCNIILSALRFLTLIVVSFMMYHLRRKVLALISSTGVGFSSLLLFFHLKFSTERYWYPLIMYMLYTFFSTVGFYGLPFIIMTEIYPLRLRGLLGGLTLACTNVESFLFTKLYPDVQDAIGISYVFLIFAISCVLGSLFLHFYLPETKGLSLHEIEEIFRGRPTLAVSLHDLSSRSKEAFNKNLTKNDT